MTQLVIRLTVSMLSTLIISSSFAQTNVVVIPLFGDSERLENIVTVAKEGGDFTDLIAAMASITDASDTNPYLVVIAPGIYDLGYQQLRMKQYVDIAGSGQNSTLIRRSVSAHVIGSGLIEGADNASLSDLSLENRNGISSDTIGIYNFRVSPTLSNLTINMYGGINQHGIYNYDSSPIISNTTITVSGGDVDSYGIYNNHVSSPTISNNIINVIDSGGRAFAIYNIDDSSADITDSRLSINNSLSTQYGVYNTDQSSATITDSTIRLISGTTNYGVFNHDESSLSLSSTFISSINGSGSDYGVLNTNNSSSILRFSNIFADSISVEDNTFSVNIIGSILNRPVSGGPTCTATLIDGDPVDEDCEEYDLLQ